eukprot:7332403-Prorocentrum_lima.AAC.1
MTSSLVGSEMCIRDRPRAISGLGWTTLTQGMPGPRNVFQVLIHNAMLMGCLLYTSDAADDM